ncbi:hypothetical protein [Longimycelium tulufanense]|nr:hypothetical protein [Longimycelium tulufanense]
MWPYIDEVGSTRSRTTLRRALDAARHSTDPGARRLAAAVA